MRLPRSFCNSASYHQTFPQPPTGVSVQILLGSCERFVAVLELAVLLFVARVPPLPCTHPRMLWDT